ncbi:MAG: dienelactone hydrolase family protein [Gammaproteobacteria bacterium]|nr:dienelactone hydrolase family protein [Gammaproteobacteria bacterium]
MSNIHSEVVSYNANGTTCKGYLAYDQSISGPRPGVLVVHEWWGLDDYIRGRANQLAGLGYTALAVDMYGDGKTADSPDQAGALMNGVLEKMTEDGTARLQASYECLKAQNVTDGARIAAIGYCFGGACVLHMARIGMDLRAVVSFHGSLGSFHKPAPGEVKPSILVCHGAADALVPDADVAAFKAEMDAAKADYRFEAYPGALHGFTNPEATARGEQYGLPLKYDAAVDKQSWQQMQDLFKQVF